MAAHSCYARVAAIAALIGCSAAFADNIEDSDRILCSVSQVLLCVEDGDCFPVSILDTDVPQFMIIDKKRKMISNTKASGENRKSAVDKVSGDGVRIFLQGVENSRPYSMLIEEDSGRLTATIARDGITISAFGACTDADVD